MNLSDTDPELFEAREQIFRLVLRQLRQLYFRQPPPDAFFIGQPYVEDEETVACIIGAQFVFPGFVPTFEFRMHGARVQGEQRRNVLIIQIFRQIPRTLWEHLKYLKRGERFIIGYLAWYMPRINRELINNRYRLGHPLSRTFAIYEATNVWVIVGREAVSIPWPIALPEFPPSAAIAPQADALFVRDFTDAMGSYFRAEYDDCIRRLITSAETFIEAKGWDVQTIPNGWIRNLFRPKPRRILLSFRQSLLRNLNLTRLSGQVINENLQFIYSTRNRIVHNGFRMGTSSALFCSKAIGTVYYLIQRYSGSAVISRYVYTLHMQFGLQNSAFGNEYNLDQIKRRMETPVENPPIDSPAVLENFMFTALRYSQRDKQSILR
jgi:hypothetical protein